MSNIKITRIPPTPPQIHYMEILFNDTGFTTNSRNAWLTFYYHRKIEHLDELGFSEAKEVIARLKEIRGDKS